MNNMTDIRAELGRTFDLAPNLALAEETQGIHARMARVVPLADWAIHAPYVAAINWLKSERNATILAHNYMTPEIYHGVADFVGDSLQLAMKAAETEAEVIVQCGVHFMAETSKILSPGKTVLMPDMDAGCSLAESITPEGVEEMRSRYPGAPVVTYVNTSAEVKAVSDICCTSSNALQIVEALESDTVIMTPDRYLAQNVANRSTKRVVYWPGSCMVHELYTPEELRAYREQDPELEIIAHPECTPEVVAEADYAGSTAEIIRWVHDRKPARALLVTECSMASNIADELPEVEFARPCNLCPHMKRITLEKVLWSLHTMTTPIEVAPEVASKAQVAVQRMIEMSRKLGL